MNDALVKRVASAMGARDYAQAKTAIREVLQWYSVPTHITEHMMHAVNDSVSDNEGRVVEKTICMAMRAARDDL